MKIRTAYRVGTNQIMAIEVGGRGRRVILPHDSATTDAQHRYLHYEAAFTLARRNNWPGRVTLEGENLLGNGYVFELN